ncbi:retrovirus-related pol polyprotein from transposon TNT 1-94 [Tanacetum coccineum]
MQIQTKYEIQEALVACSAASILVACSAASILVACSSATILANFAIYFGFNGHVIKMVIGLSLEEYLARDLLVKSKRFFKKDTQRFRGAKATDQTECHKCGRKGHFARDCFSKTSVPSYQSPFQPKFPSSSSHKPELRPTKDFEDKYNKVKAKLALLKSSASAPKSSLVKNKGLIVEDYELDKEEVSSYDNEMVEVKVLMALADDNDAVSKESARNHKWVKIYMRKVHTLLEIEDNDDRKNYLDYLCIDLNYVEEQRSNLLSKHRNLVLELNTCKEQLLVIKQAKLNFLTMQHVIIEILKENQKLRKELKELKSTTETWLNSSNKVNKCISEQIPSQKKRILGVD